MHDHTNGTTAPLRARGLTEKANKKREADAENEMVIPLVKDLNIDNITPNVIAVNSNVKDNPRLQYIITKLIQVSHDFCRDANITFDEWTAAWQFLTKVGQISDDVRHEMVLLSDILGISALVDSLSYPHKPGSTESSILGPFHDEESQHVENGEAITKDTTAGEATLVRGYVRSLRGKPVSRALIDVWETDGLGVYDLEYDNKDGPDCRGKFFTDDQGAYAFTCVRPVGYPISNDGPVGELLRVLNRHWYRPAHMHFMVDHPDYNKLITAVYDRDSKYIESDVVFGVKSSLMVDFTFTEDAQLAEKYGLKTFTRKVDGTDTEGFWLLEFNFVLTEKEEPPAPKLHD